MRPPMADVLRIAHTMSDMSVSGTPRNYELFHAAMSGQFMTLQNDLRTLGKHPQQSELDFSVRKTYYAIAHRCDRGGCA